MQKLTVNDAAEKLGISKEAIYNRIRRNTIKSIEENGIKYVILDDSITNKPKTNITNAKKESSVSKNDFVKYLIAQIEELKIKNKTLQEDKEKLFREKEEILISTKDEIKTMYQERDEKLKYFLSLFEKPLLAKSEIKKEKEPFEIIIDSTPEEWISMGEYIERLNLKRKKRSKVKKLLIKNIGKSEFIKIESGILYINENLNLKKLKE